MNERPSYRDAEAQRISPLPQPEWLVPIRALISVLGLTALLVFLGIPNGAGATVGCLVYVVAGTLLRPKPDYSNVGWFGGLVDHPFRLSDDYNRFLIFLLLFLWPARVIGSGFVMLFRWLVRGDGTSA